MDKLFNDRHQLDNAYCSCCLMGSCRCGLVVGYDRVQVEPVIIDHHSSSRGYTLSYNLYVRICIQHRFEFPTTVPWFANHVQSVKTVLVCWCVCRTPVLLGCIPPSHSPPSLPCRSFHLLLLMPGMKLPETIRSFCLTEFHKSAGMSSQNELTQINSEYD